MAYDTDTFRARYRAGIHPAYSALLHGGFVFVYAAAWLVYYVRALGAREVFRLVDPANRAEGSGVARSDDKVLLPRRASEAPEDPRRREADLHRRACEQGGDD